MAKGTKDASRRRAIVVFFAVILLFVWAVSYLVRWQIVRGEELKTRAMNQSLRTTTLTAGRGTIYDATGTKVLAQSASVWTVILEPNYIDDDEDRALIADGLSVILEMDREDIYKKTKENSGFTYLKRKIETEKKDEILAYLKEKKIGRGVRTIEDYKRYYPYGAMASTVLGFIGTDNTGLLGLEMEYEEELSGTKGRLVSAKNAIGTDMPFQYEQLISAENGYDLVLTLDETVQSIVEKYLAEGVVKNGVKNGATAVVMNVETGAIIALATGDNFDLNDPFTIANKETSNAIELLPKEEQDGAYNTALYKQWRNKAVSDTYYPGSVFKMVTASMALDGGYITEDTAYSCSGSYKPASNADEINCWYGPSRGGHGTLTVREGICNSCNPFFMKTGEAMGADNFFRYFEAFGFTKSTGIDLPGEAIGIYHTPATLGPVELATVSFGQNFGVTPIQMITAASSIANGGYIVQPHVVDRILDAEGNIIKSAETNNKRQVISKETAAMVTDYLQENVATGSGRNGNVPGYRVCGKTGTSEKMDKWLQDTTKPKEYIASFCGFAPAEDPKYALLVYFDEPERESASGGTQAAPVFADIMREILPYLGVESQLSASEFKENMAVAPSVVGKTIKEAKAIINENNLTYDVFGAEDDDQVVVMQIPSAGKEMPKDGTVVIASETIGNEDLVEVPDFTGKSVSECNDIAANLGIQIVLTGASTTQGDIRAQNQSVPFGEKVRPGTVITLTVIDSSGLE